MFNFFKPRAPKFTPDMVANYHRQMSILETEDALRSIAEDEIKQTEIEKNLLYKESNRPTEQSSNFELYKDFAIEHFPRARQYRILVPLPDTEKSRWSSAQGLKDIGLAFNLYGDACNYIDKYLLEPNEE